MIASCSLSRVPTCRIQRGTRSGATRATRHFFRHLVRLRAFFAAVAVLLLLAGAPVVWAGSPPIIDSVTASAPTVTPGGTLTFNVTAHDPDCAAGTCTSGCGAYIRADLTAWAAGGGTFVAFDNGSPASPYSASAQWQAPAVEGTYSIQVTVADSGTFLCGGRNSVAGQLSVSVSTSTNLPPQVHEVSASPAQLTLGATSVLKCRASDPESDPLVYSWSADRGTLVQDGELATFTGDRPGLATVTCLVSDSNGATATGTVRVSFTDAVPETRVQAGLTAPQRVALDPYGTVYVADAGRGALVALSLADGALVYALPWAGVTSVAVDWDGRLLVGDATGARVVTREGASVLALDPGEPLGAVADVAVDAARRRYAVLHHAAARVIVYDEEGQRLAALGGNGDAASQLRRPQGLAFTPAGELVVADGGHALIKVLRLDGTLRTSFGGSGSTPGRFVRLDDVAVDDAGVIYASDAFQSWVQSFDPDGTLREVIGTWGDAPGRFRTATGIAVSTSLRKLVVASLNTPSLEVFRASGEAAPARLPRPVLSTTALSFPLNAVGGVSRGQSVSLVNAGDAPLGLHQVHVNGEFRLSGGCAPFLDPGQACTLQLSYVPETPGVASGALVFDTSANPRAWQVALAGEAYVPALARLEPSRMEFRPQRAGTLSEPRSVTLANVGGRPLALAGARVSPAFALAGGCPAQIAPGESCRLSVFFAPDAAGPWSGALTVDSNAANAPLAVALTGLALAPPLEAQPARLDFGPRPVGGRGRVASLVLANKLAEPVPIDVVELTSAAPFALLADECSGTRLAGGGTCTLRIQFAPVEEGEFEARVRAGSVGDAQDVALVLGRGRAGSPREPIFSDDFETLDLSRWAVVASGESELPLGVASGERELDLGVVPEGWSRTHALRLTNAGSEPLVVQRVELVGASEGALAAGACAERLLAPRAGCFVTLRVDPRPVRSEPLTLAVTTSAGREVVHVTVRALSEAAP